MLAIAFPTIDPVVFEIGPVVVRWYAVAYVLGLLIGWRYVRLLARLRFPEFPPRAADDLLIWCTLGVVVGGRLGYVLFYQPSYFVERPAEIFQIWQGGMSFHGGLVGTIIALIAFARVRKLRILTVADLLSCTMPIGLFLGRVANFINGELYGRASDVSWAMVFPTDPESVPRHPSQLYQAAMEGVILYAILTAIVFLTRAPSRPGLMTGIFLTGYGIARIIGELFREPDSFMGFLAGGITMGQVLSLPMLAFGLYLLIRALQPGSQRAPS
ncbi:MAG: prolipoprotein diacylglyceryl transferase [Alphaproteobacteria bacterium]|nr:prolipoprotein diacylglyceryl transferase [Alphaproteobacteria bacterium]